MQVCLCVHSVPHAHRVKEEEREVGSGERGGKGPFPHPRRGLKIVKEGDRGREEERRRKRRKRWRRGGGERLRRRLEQHVLRII